MAKDVVNLRILRRWFLFCVTQVGPRGHYRYLYKRDMYLYKRDMEEDLVQTPRREGDVMIEAETEVM